MKESWVDTSTDQELQTKFDAKSARKGIYFLAAASVLGLVSAISARNPTLIVLFALFLLVAGVCALAWYGYKKGPGRLEKPHDND
jgi:NADH:ubiquinone oxidoreductase subunit 2 (subunit N)